MKNQTLYDLIRSVPSHFLNNIFDMEKLIPNFYMLFNPLFSSMIFETNNS